LEEEAEERGPGQWRLERDARIERLTSAGVPVEVARQTVAAFELVHVPNMIEVAGRTGRSPIDVAGVFHHLGHVLELDELERVVAELELSDPWQKWARETIEDDLLSVRRSLAQHVLEAAQDLSIEDAVQQFIADRADSVVWIAELIRSLELGTIDNAAPLLVVVRQIQNLAGLSFP
jgi:glutamate dehydrogenase